MGVHIWNHRSQGQITKAEWLKLIADNPTRWGLRLDKISGRLAATDGETVLETHYVIAWTKPHVRVLKPQDYGVGDLVPLPDILDPFALTRQGEVLLPMTAIIDKLQKDYAEFDDPFTCLEGGKIIVKWVK
jgi:hypothetical protein